MLIEMEEIELPLFKYHICSYVESPKELVGEKNFPGINKQTVE